MTEDAPPRGRLARAWRLSKLGARLGATQARVALTGSTDHAVHEHLASVLEAELGAMKGVPTKVGQMLSYLDGLIPEAQAPIYQRLLSSLRTRSNPAPPGACEALFAAQFGAPPSKTFEDFEPNPIAAGSIGQVYRARLDGQRVAVKIQYPGIRDIGDADLRSLDTILAIVRRILPTIDIGALLHDFEARLREECDYTLEASHQRKFHQRFHADPTWRIPGVIDAFSNDVVLTTQWMDGIDWDEFLREADASERDGVGAALFRLVFDSLLNEDAFHADPHPGNFLFRSASPQGIALLDFGCVQPIDQTSSAAMRRLLSEAVGGNVSEEAALDVFGTTAIDPSTREVVTRLTRQMLEPITSKQPYRFESGFAAALSKDVLDAKTALTPAWIRRQAHWSTASTSIMSLVRVFFGLASIWSALGSEADYRRLTKELLHV